ncbi:hypothetical protein [Amycolatopsis pithecellobii]|uniref:hypothetical protein n=1 Tax=Amycolatopsis pithecellobii TaxID=664692 RepID=UPI00140B9F26|nr:hypothetical protein [Amycolatopsis pithecellobii]
MADPVLAQRPARRGGHRGFAAMFGHFGTSAAGLPVAGIVGAAVWAAAVAITVRTVR